MSATTTTAAVAAVLLPVGWSFRCVACGVLRVYLFMCPLCVRVLLGWLGVYALWGNFLSQNHGLGCKFPTLITPLIY
jgi:hypothetical protein